MNLLDRVLRHFAEPPPEIPAAANEPFDPVLAELQGARQRLLRAQNALRDFRLAHTAVIAGQVVYLGSDPDRASLDSQHAGLLVELDAAARGFQKALADWASNREETNERHSEKYHGPLASTG